MTAASQATATRTTEAKARYDGFTLTLERRFAHPRERVFDAWTRPEALRSWFGPEGMSSEGAEADVRVGGSYRVPMVGPDGDDHIVYGTYEEIDPPSRLVFTWAWEVCGDDPGGYEMLVTVEFQADGDATLMTLHQEGLASAEARDRHDEGWSSSFNCLDAYLG